MIKSVKQKIGYRIKLARMLKNLSREELAERLQVTTNYIYKIEAGIGGFSLETIEKIAVAIGVDIAYFYDWREESDGIERVKDIELPFGKKLEDRIVDLIQQAIQQQSSSPAIPVSGPVDEITKLILQLPAEQQKKIIDAMLAEKFKH